MQRLNAVLNVKLTTEEKALILRVASEQGYDNISEFVRTVMKSRCNGQKEPVCSSAVKRFLKKYVLES